MSQYTRDSGYRHVNLMRDGKQYNRLVHRIVLQTFGPPCPGAEYECCHDDGNPAHNNIENLYWGTQSENMMDAVRHGTHHWSKRTSCSRGHQYVEGSYFVSNGKRRCRACLAINRKRHAEKKRRSAVSCVDVERESA